MIERFVQTVQGRKSVDRLCGHTYLPGVRFRTAAWHSHRYGSFAWNYTSKAALAGARPGGIGVEKRRFSLNSFLANQMIGYYRKKSPTERALLKNWILEFQIGRFGWLVDLPSQIFFGSDMKMLATIYGTDKWNKHWYVQHYEELFRKIRRKRISLLEIGVGGGENPRRGGNSLRMWRAYFPNGRIYGVDLYDKTPHDRGRIKTLRGSQADPHFLDALVREIGKIDVIIDDGSHINEHMIFTFQQLFPHLADGGTYVLEDIQTSYWAEYGGNETDRNDPTTAVVYFKSLVDGLNWREFRGDYNPTFFDLNIKEITFHHNLIVIKKGSDLM